MYYMPGPSLLVLESPIVVAQREHLFERRLDSIKLLKGTFIASFRT